MKEALKYFDNLQMAIHLLFIDEVEDYRSVASGVHSCVALLDNLSFENLLSEEKDYSLFESLIKRNRSICALDKEISFLDVDLDKLNGYIESIAQAYPVFKEFHRALEENLIFDFSCVPVVDGKRQITDAYMIPNMIMERKIELLSLFPQYQESKPDQQENPEEWRLPIEFDTPEAQDYFSKLIELKLMEIAPNGCYLWKGTKKELALTAELMCERLRIPNKWKVFELIFRKNKLAQAKYKAVEVDGKYSNNEKKIREIFDN